MAIEFSAPTPGLPLQITPYSKLGKPVEKMKWWEPLGWLLILLSSAVILAVFVAMAPLILLEMAFMKIYKTRYKYRRDPKELRIAIVGGGWGGLQCLERFKRLGVTDVDLYERYDDIGGTWTKHLRYQGLQIHGSMTVTSFDEFPYSTDKDVQGGKVMAEEVEQYIHRFADTRGLRAHCHFNSNVDAVSYDSKDKKGTITITDTATGEQRKSGPYDMVIWASMAAFGDIPKIPGAEKFAGKQLHTIQYKPEEFQDIIKQNKKVIIVGGGKAGVDVALSLRRAGYGNFMWLMRKPFLFYKYESLLHDASFKNKVRGVSYLCTVLWCGVSTKLGAVLHWSSGHLATFGKPHTDFTHFHGGVMCATQRKDIADVPFTLGEIASFGEDHAILKDGSRVDCDVVIWATGNKSGIDTLKLEKDGQPLKLDPNAKLYNHFIVPEIPVLASSTALWTTFGPMRATNSADLTVHHFCVRKERTQQQMEKVAGRQMSSNSIIHSFIWAHNMCWLQQWVYFHIDLMIAGITPLESFLKHAIEVFVLSKEAPLNFNILPKGAMAAPHVEEVKN